MSSYFCVSLKSSSLILIHWFAFRVGQVKAVHLTLPQVIEQRPRDLSQAACLKIGMYFPFFSVLTCGGFRGTPKVQPYRTHLTTGDKGSIFLSSHVMLTICFPIYSIQISCNGT